MATTLAVVMTTGVRLETPSDTPFATLENRPPQQSI
jgi:hypothetical protein